VAVNFLVSEGAGIFVLTGCGSVDSSIRAVLPGIGELVKTKDLGKYFLLNKKLSIIYFSCNGNPFKAAFFVVK
jgi:hypothetical protein